MSVGKTIICDFCCKDRSKVRYLIAGHWSHICNECIELSVKILAAYKASETTEVIKG